MAGGGNGVAPSQHRGQTMMRPASRRRPDGRIRSAGRIAAAVELGREKTYALELEAGRNNVAEELGGGT
ncbi:hypothetical protein E2562_018315 [Oryza meyeriana var. granulata]|uniref:Uncharacterized protein n=1 Tax=Oryza meyeriana var. granulata TaxID=110450 RepID=A0A6G1CRE9_9ORYZ|nr:hypothetical protein E2562_018315 [Oryza meyeriana var. granulata]